MIPRQGKLSLEHRLAEMWNKEFLGAPYKIGGMTKEEGFDCISLTYTLLCRLGADIKPFWNNVDITNYWVNYDLELIPTWIRTLGVPIKVEFRQAGDILLCQLTNKQWLASIFLGGTNCAIVNGETDRVGTCPYKLLKPFIIEVRRCLV